MNARMNHGNLAPVGFCVQNGKQITPVNLANGEGNFFLKPPGDFLVSKNGARVVVSMEYPNLGETILLATQSGPLLLRSDKIHPAFNLHSESRLFRNGVGVASSNEVIFAIRDLASHSTRCLQRPLTNRFSIVFEAPASSEE